MSIVRILASLSLCALIGCASDVGRESGGSDEGPGTAPAGPGPSKSPERAFASGAASASSTLPGPSGPDAGGGGGFKTTVEVSAGPEIVAVNWGSGVNPTLTQNEDAFYGDIVKGSYLNLLNEYGVGTYGASYKGQYTITPQDGRPWLFDDEIQSELIRDIKNHSVPYPDNDTIYVIHLPPNVQYLYSDDSGDSPDKWAPQCAYHNNDNWWTGVFTQQNVNYAVIGDWGTVCSGAHTTQTSYINDMTVIISHEVIEAATDADGNHNRFSCNTSSNQQEIGDCCRQAVNLGNNPEWTTFQGSQHAWFVERAWSGFYAQCSPYTLPTPNTPSAMQSSSAAVSRSPGNMDVFYTKSSCSGFFCQTSLYNDYWYAGQAWGQSPVTGAPAWPLDSNANIAAITINSSYLDTYYFDIYGRVETSWWSAGGKWASYELAPSVYANAPAGAALTAVAPAQNAEEVFHVDHAGNILEYSWRAGASAWKTRTISIPAARLAEGQNIAAVARTSQNIDLFFVGGDNNLWTAFTYDAADEPSASWSWGPITQGGLVQPRSPVAAAARTWSNLDVYYFQNGEPMVASWSAGAPSWTPQVAYTSAPPPVAAHAFVSMVSRSPHNLDAYYIDANGNVETSYFDSTSGSQFSLWQTSAATGIGGYSNVSATGFLGATPTPSSTQNLNIFVKGWDGPYYNYEWTTAAPSWRGTSLP